MDIGDDDDDDDGDDGDWAVDTSEAAVKAREDAAQASFDKIEAAMGEAKVSEDGGGGEGKKKKGKKVCVQRCSTTDRTSPRLETRRRSC